MPRTDGFALVSALTVMILVTLITFMLVTTSTSELMQTNSSQGLMRARALAEASVAESYSTVMNDGVTKANQVLLPYVDTFAAGSQDAATTAIIPTGSYNTVLSQLNTVVQTSTSITAPNAIGTSSGTLTFKNFRVDLGSFSKAGQTYYVDYVLNGQGNSGSFKRNIETSGTLRLILGRTYLNQYVLLADDGGFTERSCITKNGKKYCSGGGYFGTGSVFDGPVHFNKNLALAGSPVFQYGLTVASPTTYMWDCQAQAWAVTTAQSTDCAKPDYGGYGQQHVSDAVTLPPNAFSQGRAALGGDENNQTALTTKEICLATGKVQNCTPTNGVYVPNSSGTVSGGIYIQGNAQDVQLSVEGQNQVYRITDEAGVVTVIKVNVTAKTTSVKTGSGQVVNLTGVPNGQFYVNGNIQSLRGPARNGSLPNPAPSTPDSSVVPPAIAEQTQLNVASSGDIRIQGDLTYEKNPNQNPDAKNVLGIISGGGQVLVGQGAPNDVYVMGSILAGATGKGLKVEGIDDAKAVYGYRGKVHLLGSLAEATDQLRGIGSVTGGLVKGYDDDFKYDKRFLNGGVVPPYFPATTKFGVTAFIPQQRTWEEK
ncbi:DUF4900 domain-containing protein [Deinococcus sedimenti]|nr:DUF4900 domain-containing protein [Deinococcus sedimenti]